jgi:hypothetical protein
MATDFTIADVLAWARTKPAGQAYSYMDIFNCALCQFLRETGRAREPQVGGYDWRDTAVPGSTRTPFDERLKAPLCGTTFGQLVKRLEMVCPADPVSDTWTKADAYLESIDA